MPSLHNSTTEIFSSTISIATVIDPVIGGSIAFVFDYIAVMYFAIAVIIVGFVVSLKIKAEKINEVPI